MGNILNVESLPSDGYYMRKGANVCDGTFAGYTTGSGNYFAFFVPCAYDESITQASISVSANSDITAYLIGDWWNAGGMTLSDCTLYKKASGLMFEIKFTSTQTANRPCAVRLNENVTITLS